MRIRSIRPEFWSSEDVAEMDWHTRLVYIGLWSYVDDNGVGRDVDRLITAALFPLDGDLPESSRRVTGALRHLSDRGQITRYRVGDKRYLHVAAWSTHQRIEKASKGRYPLPTSDDAEIEPSSPTTPGALPDISALGEGEKGRRGEEIPTYASPASDDEIPLPDDWEPTSSHIERAAKEGLDLDHEVGKFRSWVEEKRVLSKSWNARFTRWLINAAEYAAKAAERDRNRPARPAQRDRHAENLEVVRQIAIRDGYLPPDDLLQIGAP